MNRRDAWKLLYGINAKPVSEKFKLEDILPHSWDVFLEALSSDFLDIQGGTTPEGIHLGAMSGTLDIVQRCYTGLVIRDKVMWLNPRLPDSLESLSFNLRFRKQSLRIEITQSEAKISALHALVEKVQIGFRGKVHTLKDDQSLKFSLKDGSDSPSAVA